MIKILCKSVNESELALFDPNGLQHESLPKLIFKELKLKTTVFPDKTKMFRIEKDEQEPIDIDTLDLFYYYTSPDDFIDLKTVTDLLAQNRLKTTLFIAYMPNARMDRIKSPLESYSLKSFTQYLKTLKVENIFVFDPHSSATNNLLEQDTYLGEMISNDLLKNVLEAHVEKTFNNTNFYLAFPDEGSQKRYMDTINYCSFKDRVLGVFVGSKARDWKTGEIKRVDVNIVNGEWIIDKEEDHNVLIIDDICSKGGTFKYFIEAMNKEYGANINYYLYVSHMEPAILDGDLLNEDKPMVKNVLTTNSLSHHILYENDRYKSLKNNPLIKIESLEENYLKLFHIGGR